MKAAYQNRHGTLPTTAGTRYQIFMYNTSTVTTDIQIPVGGNYTLRNLRVRLSSGVGATMTHVLTLRKNGVNTSMSITTDAASTTFADTTNSVSVVPGDTLSYELVTTGTGGSASFLALGIEMEGTTAGDGSPLGSGSSASLSNTATRYLAMQAGPTDTASNNAEQVIPVAGTISAGYGWLNGAPGTAGSGKNYTVTLVKNGSDTALTFAITDTATTSSDTSNSVSVVAGDTVYWKVVPNSTPTNRAITIGCKWTPTTDGYYLNMYGGSTAPSTTATNYNALGGNGSYATSTQQRGGPITSGSYTLGNLYAKVASAPGTGKSLAFTMMSGSSAQSTTCTISDTNTTASDTSNTFSPTSGSVIEFRVVPTGTPTTAATLVSWTTYQTPTYAGGEFGLMMMDIGS